MCENTIESLLGNTLFAPDEQSGNYLKGTILVKNDLSNPIREVLAACGLREYVKHFLNTVSPDTELKNCGWCQVEKGIKLIDRLRFWITGGLSIAFLKAHLGFNDQLYKKDGEFMVAHDNLSRFLHSGNLNTETFGSLEHTIVSSLREIQEVHDKILDKLEEEIHELSSELVDSIDFSNISTGMIARYCLESSSLDEMKLKIKSSTLVLDVSGTVEGSLEFGDYEPTDPYMPQSWPYKARFTLDLQDLYAYLNKEEFENVFSLIMFQAPGDIEPSWIHDGDFFEVQFPEPYPEP